jgi:hypothetical protein
MSLDGKVLGWLGGSGRTLKKFGWIHEIACPSENELYVAELLNWRAQTLIFKPRYSDARDGAGRGDRPADRTASFSKPCW